MTTIDNLSRLALAMKKHNFILKTLIVAICLFYSSRHLEADSGVRICGKGKKVELFIGRCPRGFRTLHFSEKNLNFNLTNLPFTFIHSSTAQVGALLPAARKIQLQFSIFVQELDDGSYPDGELRDYPNFNMCKTWHLKVKLDKPIAENPQHIVSRTFQLRGYRENDAEDVLPLTDVCAIPEGESSCSASGSQNPPVDRFYLITDTPNRNVPLSDANFAYFYIVCKP